MPPSQPDHLPGHVLAAAMNSTGVTAAKRAGSTASQPASFFSGMARFAALYWLERASLRFISGKKDPTRFPSRTSWGLGIGCAHERRVKRSDAGRQSKRNPMRASQGRRARLSERSTRGRTAVRLRSPAGAGSYRRAPTGGLLRCTLEACNQRTQEDFVEAQLTGGRHLLHER